MHIVCTTPSSASALSRMNTPNQNFVILQVCAVPVLRVCTVRSCTDKLPFWCGGRGARQGFARKSVPKSNGKMRFCWSGWEAGQNQWRWYMVANQFRNEDYIWWPCNSKEKAQALPDQNASKFSYRHVHSLRQGMARFLHYPKAALFFLLTPGLVCGWQKKDCAREDAPFFFSH